MIGCFRHQGPTADRRATVGKQTPTEAVGRRISSGFGSLHGWRRCASIVAVVGLLALVGAAHAAQLTLTWTDASTNEDGFKIERATGTAGAYGLLASVGADTTGYVDPTVAAGTTYCYRVRAYNTAGDSAYSNAACAAPASATLYTVTVGKAGAGSGTVASSPTAIDCGSTCSASVASGTSLALSATPSPGSTFSGWSGGCSGTGNCALVVNANTSLTAAFAVAPTSYTLTLTKSGNGTVTSSPNGITCGTTCSASYTSGASVTLTATPATGSTFTGWSGACTGTGTCTVSMTSARSVTATFAAAPVSSTYVLSVNKNGGGTGIVASTPPGINCGAACSASFTSGAVVTLEAMPDAGSTFAGWGGACAGAWSCTVTMSQLQSVTATFAPQSVTLTITNVATDLGQVSSNPAGIDCGTTCSLSVASGSVVTLNAKPTKFATFVGWSGACAGKGSCTVVLTQAKGVTATFKRKNLK